MLFTGRKRPFIRYMEIADPDELILEIQLMMPNFFESGLCSILGWVGIKFLDHEKELLTCKLKELASNLLSV